MAHRVYGTLQVVVVDARGHMLGRLASILAKQLLNGVHIVSSPRRCQRRRYTSLGKFFCPILSITLYVGHDLIWFSMLAGGGSHGSHMHIRRNCAPENEVRALSPKAYEHTTQQGSNSLPRPLTNLVENYSRVCVHILPCRPVEPWRWLGEQLKDAYLLLLIQASTHCK